MSIYTFPTWVGESVSYATPLLPLPRPSTSQIIPPVMQRPVDWREIFMKQSVGKYKQIKF